MKRRRILGFLTGLALVMATLFAPSAALAADPVKVTLDGQPLTFDVAPRLMNGYTLLPVRAIAEALGFTVTPNADSTVITIEKGDQQAVLYVGSADIEVNGAPSQLATPVVIIEGRTLVHLRLFEQLGFDVTWHGATSTVQITNAYTIDEAALALLLQAPAAEGAIDQDLDGTAKIKFIGALAELGDIFGGDELEVKLGGKSRGNDLLFELAMPNFLEPGGADMAFGLALHEGNLYVQLPPILGMGTEWLYIASAEELGVPVSFDTQAQAAMVAEFTAAVKKAELGAVETVAGVEHQWVHLVVDLNKLAELPEEFGPMPASDIAYAFLVHPETGHVPKVIFESTMRDDEMITELRGEVTGQVEADGATKMVMLFTMTISVEGETGGIEMRFDLNTQPNDAPIDWPAFPTEMVPLF